MTTRLALAPVETLREFVVPGPRYTSYPPATRFTPAFGADAAGAEFDRLRAEDPDAPISLYSHVPFCSSLCWYCGCNVVATKDRARGTSYLDLVIDELRMVAERIGRRPIAELALGGGSPNFLRAPDLERLVAAVDATFDRTDDAVFGVELDPRDTPTETVAALAAVGFRRLSVGIQDFSTEVQRRIHRHQSEESTRQLIEEARRQGFTAINGDLVYGLPGQTPETFAATLDAVISMQPEQVALFGYAHLPDRIPHQKLVERDGPVPGLRERAKLLEVALHKFDAAGYQKIGLDHFARPDAPLAAAAREGTLHRNFQGYVVKKADYLIAVGATGISDTGRAYWQNAPLADWEEKVRRGQLPVVRGVRLTDDDILRRHVITRLMCEGELDFAAVEAQFPIRFDDYFTGELTAFDEPDAARLAAVDRRARRIEATDLGRHLIRNVCMIFDPHLDGPGGDRARFSRTL